MIFLEKLYRDFKFYTEDNDVELIKEYMEHGEEKNAELYEQFCQLEEQYYELSKDVKEEKKNESNFW